MAKNKLIRLIAVCTACLSMGVFAFSGCKKKTAASTGNGNTVTIPDDETPKTEGPDVIGGDNTGNENPGDNTGNTGTETPGDNTGNTGTETPGDNTGNTGTETPGDNTGNTGTETPGDNTGNTGTETPGDNTGNTGTETPGDNTGNTGTETPGDNTGNTGTETPGDNTGNTGTETPGDNTGNTGNEGGNTGNQGGTTTPTDPPKDPDDGVKDPVVSEVKNGPKITKSSKNELEAAYVEWTAAENAKWYNVYYSVADANDWQKLDAPLVRQYSTYYRADMVGLKAGEYDMKVVPVSADDKEATDYAAVSSGITVKAHTREGYAFVKGVVPGAYKADGTLKDNARVIYVTEKTKDTVSIEIKIDKNNVLCTGIQGILDGYSKGTETRPLAIRFVGNVKDPATTSKGDLQIDSKNSEANVTIEGIGNDATCNGYGIRVKNTKSLEIRNLGFVNCDSDEGDSISMQQSNAHIWVHNCDIFYGHAGSDADQVKGDGSLDSKGSDYCTYSYNHFWDSGKSNLLGNADSESSGEGGSTHLTYHHNWYDHSDSRHPRIRIATVHIYNNYFDGNSKYGVGAANNSTAFVENNYFRSTKRMKPILSANQGTDISTTNEAGQTKSNFGSENGGAVKAFGNVYDCPADKLLLLVQSSTKNQDAGKGVDCWEAATRDEKVPSSYTTVKGGNTYNNFDTASDFYKYNVDSAEQAKLNVERYAGRIDGGDLKYDFDDATQDSNYAVIPELKEAVTNYSGTIVKYGDGAEGSGSTGGNQGGNTGNEGGETGGDEPVTPVTPPATVEGEVKFVPTASGSGFTVEGTTKSHGAITIDGVSIAKDSALKLNSAGKVTFSTTEKMTITLYCGNSKSVKVDNNEKTVTAEGDYFVVSFELAAGDHTIVKGNGEGYLYMIKLTPIQA